MGTATVSSRREFEQAGLPGQPAHTRVHGARESVAPTALIVDDEPRLLHTLRQFVLKQGYEVRTATDGLSALRYLQTERPHFLLVDQHLPGACGLDILRYLNQGAPDVRVVLMSALLDDALATTARGLGATACLQKPFSLRALGNLLEQERQAAEHGTAIAETGIGS